MNKDIVQFLNKCNLVFDNELQLEGMLVPRDILLSQETYNNIKGNISTIKKFYSSSGMKSLQQNAAEKEKWPLLNLVRQLLKACNYIMRPVRISDGYTKDKKKKYKRYFRIESFKKIKSIPVNIISNS